MAGVKYVDAEELIELSKSKNVAILDVRCVSYFLWIFYALHCLEDAACLSFASSFAETMRGERRDSSRDPYIFPVRASVTLFLKSLKL